MSIQSYRDLIVWQKSMELVKKACELSQNFPEEEKFGLASQLGRTTVSIPSNIAEGYGRNSTNDYMRFLNISFGSLYESQALLELTCDLELIENSDYNEIYEQSREIERMQTSLIRKLSS